MHLHLIRIVALHEIRTVFRSKMPFILYSILLAMLLLAGFVGWNYVSKFNAQQARYTTEVQDNWMNQPERHPHRVAHYGYLVFREKAPLSFFDFGLDSYVGNSIFLEAHRQNTVNMSEAGFSNGMLRFGELSMALVLQLLVPLFIIFLGFATVAGLKQNGVLKILLCQKASYLDILAGKTAGLVAVTWLLFLPLILTALIGGAVLLQNEINAELLLRSALILFVYAIYFLIITMIVTSVSAMSKNASNALILLILGWMVCFIVIPKSAQTLGSSLYKAPDKIAFEQAIEAQVRKEGDSHDPDDPHFAALRASTLKKYGVDSVHKLQVNYGAMVMQEGERITSGIFGTQFNKLIKTYKAQNAVSVILGFFDPYLPLRNISMQLCGVDFDTFSEFQKQTEQYRFDKTTLINQIHLTQISYQNDRAQKVAQSNWQQMPPFKFRPVPLTATIYNAKWSLIALLFWLAAGAAALGYISSQRKFQL
ncbi:ABC transporter permease [Dyadobacter sp.]|uniref:ABC transporter permease n=1 Tax=Dyadobacter sp. TaxID=1914288 RepID=UPI003F6F1B70